MSSLITRGNKLYAKIKDADGEWQRHATGFNVGQEQEAERWVRDREREVRDTIRVRGVHGAGPLTVTRYAGRWIEDRKKLGLDWRKDSGHLEHYILPAIGDLLVADVHAKHLIDMITKIRTSPMPSNNDDDPTPPSQRTVYNINATVAALFRDAKLAGVIDQSPAILTARQLGPKRDKDPEWRASAVFTRGEVEEIISTPKIPHDRRVAYALELLGGLRPGESSALRWRNYDAVKQPLGELRVAKSHSTKADETKGTKTEAVRHVPVHPVLAAMLADWRARGWPAMCGRDPNENDLIVPMPPTDAAARTKRAASDPHRTYYYSGRRWREDDLPALGWRHRRHYDMRATFITLTLDDGADAAIIETRVTHTKPGRGAFAGYNRGRQWAIVCAEVAKLQVRGPIVVQVPNSPTNTPTSGLRRRVSNARAVAVGDGPGLSFRGDTSGRERRESSGATGLDHGRGPVLAACDFGLAMLRRACA